MPDPGGGRGLYQLTGLVAVALGGPGAVHDDLDPDQGGVDPLSGVEVTGHEPGAFLGVAAQDAHLVAGVPQERDDEPSERASSAGDQNR